MRIDSGVVYGLQDGDIVIGGFDSHCLRFDVFAKDIERGAHAGGIKLPDGGDGACDGFAGDKPSGQKCQQTHNTSSQRCGNLSLEELICKGKVEREGKGGRKGNFG